MNEKMDESFKNIRDAIKDCIKAISKEDDEKRTKHTRDKKSENFIDSFFNNRDEKENKKTTTTLESIQSVLFDLSTNKEFESDRLDEIRSIYRSINLLMEEDDRRILSNVINDTYPIIWKNQKSIDEKNLGTLKNLFNNLPKLFQDRLNNAHAIDIDKIGYIDTGLRNIEYITKNYIKNKYTRDNPVKYDFAKISDLEQYKIDECKKVQESSEYSNHVKPHYHNMAIYIEKYAKAKVVIEKLQSINKLCDEKEYAKIKNTVEKMINKYEKIYEENMDKYKNESQKLDNFNERMNKAYEEYQKNKDKLPDLSEPPEKIYPKDKSSKFKSIKHTEPTKEVNNEEKEIENIKRLLRLAALEQVKMEEEQGMVKFYNDEQRFNRVDKLEEKLQSLVPYSLTERAFIRAKQEGYLSDCKNLEEVSKRDYNDIVFPTMELYSEVDKKLDEYKKQLIEYANKYGRRDIIDSIYYKKEEMGSVKL